MLSCVKQGREEAKQNSSLISLDILKADSNAGKRVLDSIDSPNHISMSRIAGSKLLDLLHLMKAHPICHNQLKQSQR